MAYNKLNRDTGGTAEDRRNEASRLIGMIDQGLLSKKEFAFVEKMGDEDESVSPNQLYWLRDIKDKQI